MVQLKLIETTEWSVATTRDEMTFRVEILVGKRATRRLFRARLYRLELLRFGTLQVTGKQPEVADYRTWVRDDNFDFESQNFASVAAAKKAVLEGLSRQLGFSLLDRRSVPRKKRSTSKK